MSLTRLLLRSSLPLFAATALAQIPAFPGAEGYGGRALGGRGGDVYIVTNLNTSGAGSFADAIATVPTAGRTIVFGVSGHIHVNKTTLSKSKVTIAGQTAPGDGIGFKDGTFIISGDDIVIRHARFRYGKKSAGGDCIDLSSGTLNAILDQVSIQFSTDENISSFNSPPENLTMQWALNGWGLESHSCGGLWDQNHASCHHTLWSHNHTRNPKARPNGLLEWVNNVTYDWDIGFIMGDSDTPASWKANVIANYFLAPAGNIRTLALEKASLDRNGAPNFTVHLANNRHDSNGDGLLNGTDKGYTIVGGSEFVAGDPPGAKRYAKSLTPFASTGVPVTTDDPTVAFKKVVSKAGALRLDVSYAGPIRDEVDARMVQNLVTQTRNHISSETSLGLTNGGFGTLNSTAAPTDTDKDGMPDFYEAALGWNPAVQDHNTALANSGGLLTGTTFMPSGTVAGYTRLEEYLHFMAIPHGTVAKNVSGTPSSIVVNMAKFTSGFSASPVFASSNAVGGTVSIAGSAATFTPTLNFTGRARFDFTVTDSAGHSWTQTCALVVTNSGLPRDLIWKGDGTSNLWDISTPNWTHDGVATAFSTSFDNVTFDDSGSKTPSVKLQGTMPVATSLLVNATGSYTFAETSASQLTVLGTFTKRGTGTLTLSTTTASSIARTVLDEGTYSITSGSAGTGAMELNGGTLIHAVDVFPSTLAVNGTVNINPTTTRSFGGTWSGAGTVNANIGNNTFSLTGNTTAFAGTIKLGASTGFLRLNGSLGSPAATFDLGTSTADLINRNGNATFDLGALTGGSSTFLGGASSVNAPSTYNIGATGNSTTFSGTIGNGGLGGVTNIIKLGSGSLTLAGTSSYTGTTTVGEGDLIVNGALGNTSTTVASGAKLRGSGSIAGAVTMQAGSQISPGAGSGLVGTLTLGSAGLSLADTTLSMQLSSSPAGVNDKVQMGGGVLAASGAIGCTFSLTDGSLGAGDYLLVNGGASTSGAPTFTHNLPTGTRQTFSVATQPGKIVLSVVGNPATLTWTGATSATWDTATANNWSGATPNTFGTNDAVVINDTSAVTTITPSGTIAPRSTLVDNSTRAFTINAGLGGGVLTKSGTNILTLTGAATHAATVLNAGTVQLSTATANTSGLGAGSITLNGGSLKMFSAGDATSAGTLPNNLIVAGTSTFQVAPRCGFSGDVSGAGTLNYFTPYVRADITGDWSEFSGIVNVVSDAGGGDFRIAQSYSWPGLPLATVNLSAATYFYFAGISNSGAGTTIDVGELSGPSSSHLRGGVTGGRNFTYRIGGKTPLGGEVTFAGDIAEQNTGTTTTYIKTGAGVWRLTGSGAWNGATVVESGTLRLWPSSATPFSCIGATSVAPGATLDLGAGSFSTEAINIDAGASLVVQDDFNITGDINNEGTATILAGHLNVTGDVVNNGTMRMQGLSTLNATGEFTNNGLLDLLTSSASLPANFINNGTVILNTERRILSASKAAANFTVTVQGYTGHTYQLQSTTALGAAWTAIGAAIAGSGAMLNLTDTAATGSAKFYRVVVTP